MARSVRWRARPLLRVVRADGTALQQDYSSFGYTLNGQRDWVEDANGNRSDYVYDGFDRLCRLFFPQVGVGTHTANAPVTPWNGYSRLGQRPRRCSPTSRSANRSGCRAPPSARKVKGGLVPGIAFVGERVVADGPVRRFTRDQIKFLLLAIRHSR